MKFFRLRRLQRATRSNLLIVAIENFPGGLLKTAIGISLLAAPFLLKIFSDLGVDSLAIRILLNGLVIVVVPTTVLYIVTLVRAPGLRRKAEAVASSHLQVVAGEMAALRLQEEKEEKEIIRLQELVKSDRNERRVKDEQEEKRWQSLNERLRKQEETGRSNIDLNEKREVARQKLASDERILVAQKVKSITDQREVDRSESDSTGKLAQDVKDKQNDERWESLNERMRVENVAGQRNEDAKEEREVARQEQTASVDLLAQQVKDQKEDDRWDLLNERMAAQDLAGQQDKEEKEEREVARQEQTASVDLLAQQIKDLKEDVRWKTFTDRQESDNAEGHKNESAKEQREVARQKLTASVDLLARQANELREDERWNSFNERMRIENAAGQQSEDAKEEREVARQEQTASVDLLAQQLKEQKEDDRWDLLNENLRLRQEEAGKRSEALKDERENLRQKLATGVLKAEREKAANDDERWNVLHERLRIQEELGTQRDNEQALRDEEQQRLRAEDAVRGQYDSLLARYIRQELAQGGSTEVADGLKPLPEQWLKQQPEIVKNPQLLRAIRSFMQQ